MNRFIDSSIVRLVALSSMVFGFFLLPGTVLAQLTCDSISCGPGFRCYDGPQGPVCLPKLTCDDISCAEGFHCLDTGSGPSCVPDDPVSVGPNNVVYIPSEYHLKQNYPNPFNPSTTISYDLPAESWVSLKVYNLFGQEVATLVEGRQEAGYKTVEWNASNVSSGVYFYRLRAGSFIGTRKLILLK